MEELYPIEYSKLLELKSTIFDSLKKDNSA